MSPSQDTAGLGTASGKIGKKRVSPDFKAIFSKNIRKNIYIALAVSSFFSALYITGGFGQLGNKVYDLFLHFRQNRDQADNIVFLDVDDPAIAYNGVFPWPRSVMADSLLRLKEYGAKVAIFDIEFIDRGPQGVDTIYLDQNLPAYFEQSFSEIDSAATDIFAALGSGRLGPDSIGNYSMQLSLFMSSERDNLLERAKSVARDNDLYLFQASSLFGRSWSTLNLRPAPLTGEQAERRLQAEEFFSYPVNAAPSAIKGTFVDVLSALPGFSQAAQGAGFTNAEIDDDGIRRRIFLAQNIHDHWYLQLAFAPILDYLGNPEIELTNTNLTIKDADTGNGKHDIAIPLDGAGRMLIDWPAENYADSYTHISFEDFSILETIEAELTQVARVLGTTTNIPFFAQYDASLARMPFIINNLVNLFDEASAAKADALENNSDESFDAYVAYRRQSHALIEDMLANDPASRIKALVPEIEQSFPDMATQINDEAQYIAGLLENIRVNLDSYNSLNEQNEQTIRDAFCIIGRTDTGTTDMGSNPFHSEYINVGTHGVILDMILSESFITPISMYWHILFTVMTVIIIVLASAKLPPLPRTLASFLAIIVVLAVSVALFRIAGIFFNPLLAVVSMIGMVIVREIVFYTESEQEKQFIRKAFSTYVSDEVVKEIIADPARLQLGGTMRRISAVFTDIKGFTSISEKLGADKLVSLLNRYLTIMSDVILGQKGIIDKYEGDAIIAFFGAPVDLPDHALRACASAIVMKQLEKEFNRTIMAEGLSATPLLTRVGINTGDIVVGNVGTANKMDYTIMGSAVNMAARLEQVNKQYGTWILASDETVRETGSSFLKRKIDRIRVVGMDEPVQIYELINVMENATPQEKNFAELFDHAVDRYNNRSYQEAINCFQETLAIEGGGPSQIYIERCKTFMASPPPESWDGVYTLTEK